MSYQEITPERAAILKTHPQHERGYLNNFLIQYSFYDIELKAHYKNDTIEGAMRRHECYEGLNCMRYVLNQLGVTDQQLNTLIK